MGSPRRREPLIGAASAVHHLLMVAAAAWLFTASREHLDMWALPALAFGWTTLSLIAYSIHRFIFHGNGSLALAHAHHHNHPLEEQIDLVSYVGPMAIMLVFWMLVVVSTGSMAIANAIAAGHCLGYSWFRLVHRLAHVPQRPAAFFRYVAAHDTHHDHPDANFGVTTLAWDWLFSSRFEGAAATGLRGEAGSAQAEGGVAPGRDVAAARRFPIALHDPCPGSDAPRGPLERWCLPWLCDVRDLVFVRLSARFMLTVPPFALALYLVPGRVAAALALPYLALLYLVWGGPAMLMVHAVSHRRTFRGAGAILQNLIRHGLPLSYGVSPFAYGAHHVLMHHNEENAESDLSSTLGHVRDSPAAFAGYYARFLFFGQLHMTAYLATRSRWRTLALFWIGEAGLLMAVVALYPVAPVATLVTLVCPFVLTRFFLMAGNWAQHAFVDPAAPTDGMRNATVLVNATQNQRCFNDGYHAVHHRYRGMHWADMASHFRNHWQAYARAGVIVFSGIPNQQVVWWCLMRKNYRTLADHMLDLGERPRTSAEKISLLQRRTRTVLIRPKGMLELRERARAS